MVTTDLEDMTTHLHAQSREEGEVLAGILEVLGAGGVDLEGAMVEGGAAKSALE